MREGNLSNFGIVIAYLLPGLVLVWGLSTNSETVRGWLGATPREAPTVGGFLYATVGALGAGIIVSAIRWMIIDRLHHATGVRPPKLKFGRLTENFEAFEGLVENHYRFYQAYANTLVAVVIAYPMVRKSMAIGCTGFCGVDLITILVLIVLFLGSRDSLSRYYDRTQQLLRKSR